MTAGVLIAAILTGAVTAVVSALSGLPPLHWLLAYSIAGMAGAVAFVCLALSSADSTADA